MIAALFLYLIFIPAPSDGANSITWYEPPPVETTTNNADIKTDNIQLVKGSTNVPLSWNFTLGQNLNLVVLQLFSGSVVVATITSSGQAEIAVGHSDRFSVSWINSQKATLVILKVTANNSGEFSCKVTTLGGGSKVWTRKIKVNVVVAPTATIQQCLTPVTEGDNATLYCNATGNPPSSIAWIRANTKKVLSNNEMHMITAVKRNESGSYECHASNGIGNNSTKSCTIDVQYRSKIVHLPSEYNVAVQESVSLHCQAEGNPTPSFTWTPCIDGCDKSTLVIPEVLKDTVYTCEVSNALGSDSANTSVAISGKEINITLTITSESCTDGQYNKTLLSNRVTKEIDKVFAGKSAYTSTTLKDVRCGSLIFDLSLKFSSLVSDKWVLSILKEATKDGKLGEFNVVASSIKRTRPVISTSTSPLTGKTTPRLSDGNMIWIIVGAVLGCIVFIAIIVAVVVLYVRKQEKKSKNDNKEVSDKPGESHTVSYAESAGNTYYNAVEMEVRQPDHIPSWQQTSEVPSRSQYMALDDARRSDDLPEVTTTTDTSHTSQYAPLHPSTLSREIPRENVTIEKIIGKGAFGQVAKGTVFGIRGRAQMTLVAVKMLKANAPVSDMKDLLSELEVMKTLKPHPHVIKLLGCVTESEPLLVLIEYVPYGDLLGYLRKSRGLHDTYYQDPDIKPQTSLTSQQLMKFAWQIADGMSYLSSRSIIHRDLAARNVLVGEKETCKVTDFGMARDVQQENIYERKTKGRLPVKWTAYESLMYGTYTTKSDVWSFGILLYEIFTIGGSPYPRMDGKKIASLLHQEYRMPKPQHVDDELYKIMTACWEENPDVRPTFAELRNKLKKMENQHKRLINMKMYDIQLYANVEDLVV